jgi:hypothetical protein
MAKKWTIQGTTDAIEKTLLAALGETDETIVGTFVHMKGPGETEVRLLLAGIWEIVNYVREQNSVSGGSEEIRKASLFEVEGDNEIYVWFKKNLAVQAASDKYNLV